MTEGRESAGILLFRHTDEGIEVLIAHPGGPFWQSRETGAWTLPKGEVEPGEDLLTTALREFAEETGYTPPSASPPTPLGSVRLKSGKTVHAWAVEGDLDPDRFTSNTFTMEWPPRSGKAAEFPEIDRVSWAEPERARQLLNPALGALVDRLVATLSP